MKQFSDSVDENRETADLILGLDAKLFDSNPWADIEAQGELPPDPYQTTDQMFMQYNENLSPAMAKSILGDEYNPSGSNYKMCTDLTGTTITYDNDGEEVVVKLTREEDAYIEPELREELFEDTEKPNSFPFLKKILVGLLLSVILATVFLIVVWKL